MKLTTGVNLTNILCTAFTLVGAKAQKDTDDLTVFKEA